MHEVSVVRPPGSFVIISGDLHAMIPEPCDTLQRIWSNNDSIVIGTFASDDGETVVTLTTEEIAPEFQNVFDGSIATPSKRVLISDAHLTVLSCADVQGQSSRVRVWANDVREPDHIIVQVC